MVTIIYAPSVPMIPGEFLASVYHLMKIRYGIDKPEEVCIKVFALRSNPQTPQFSGFEEVLIFRNGNLMIYW